MARVPKLRKHPRGTAFVEHRGKRIYLGPWGSEKARRESAAFLQRIQSPPVVAVSKGDRATCAQLAVAYLAFLQAKPRSESTGSELKLTAYAVESLVDLFADSPADDFGPVRLERVREAFVARGWARKYVNRQVGRLRRMWKFGVRRQLVRVDVWQALSTVEPLREGETAAPETEAVEACEWEQAAALLPFLSPVVAAMVTTQYWSGMRPSEVCALRWDEIDQSEATWLVRPTSHKNAWRNEKLAKVILPRFQAVLEPFRDRAPGFVFGSTLSRRWHVQQRNAVPERKTKVYPCERKRRAKQLARTDKLAGGEDRFTTQTYGQALRKGVERAKAAGVVLDGFSPNQLRHGIATFLSRHIDHQAAQRWLGHKNLATTDAYAKRNERELRQIAEQIASITSQLDANEEGDGQSRNEADAEGAV